MAKFTEDQAWERKEARAEATMAKRFIERAQGWHSNRSNFYASCAGQHAKMAARHAFKAHPELREN